jgi:hypothetical protein
MTELLTIPLIIFPLGLAIGSVIGWLWARKKYLPKAAVFRFDPKSEALWVRQSNDVREAVGEVERVMAKTREGTGS